LKALLFFFWITLAQAAQFVIIIPAHNGAYTFKKTLQSVLSQDHENFRIVYLDDGSTDGTETLLTHFISTHDLSSKVTFLKNHTRLGPSYCLKRVIANLDPSDIVIFLPKESFFYHSKALSELAKCYADKNVWLTVDSDIPTSIIEKNSFRSDLVKVPHIQSFYAGLFQKIGNEKLFLMNGVNLPLLEMGAFHISPLSDLIHYKEDQELDPFTASQTSYSPLPFLTEAQERKTAYITPGYWGSLFDNDNPCCDLTTCANLWCRVRTEAKKKGIDLIQTTTVADLYDFDYLIVLELFEEQLIHLSKYPKEKLVAMLWEPPSVIPANYNEQNHHLFSKIYTWKDDLIDNKTYLKFYYPSFSPQIPNLIPFDFKRLCTLVSCNKRSYHVDELYSERVNLIEFFETFFPQDFELYGKWWPAHYRTYQGEIGDKTSYVKHYKFNVSYENIKNVPGYVTEKIFDSFKAGSIPIYLGASNITETIPKNCFIDRNDFNDHWELISYLKIMSESEYLTYIQNIQLYLESEQAKLYSIDNFVNTFMGIFQ